MKTRGNEELGDIYNDDGDGSDGILAYELT